MKADARPGDDRVSGSAEERPPPLPDNPQSRIVTWMLRTRATAGIRSPHLWIIGLLLAAFAYVYYAVPTSFRDIYVILFFYPVFYAAIVYRLRGVLGSGIVFLMILLPHALLIANDLYLLLRMLLFDFLPFVVAALVATQLNYLERQVEAYEEIARLNREMTSYISLLEKTQRQLVQAEKLSAMGELAASVAHEINNPLAGILIYSKLLAKKVQSGPLDNAEALANLSKIEAAVTYCANIVRNLLDFARQSEPLLQAVDMPRVVDQAMSLVGHQAMMKNVEVVREEAAPLLPARGDFRQLQQVFVNLIINAIQAMPEGGKMTIRTALAAGDLVSVSVRDNGSGISPENLDKLFTPFFTTKKEKGAGLGLAVSYGIVQKHGGRIEVQSEVGKGTTFTVYLPVDRGGLGVRPAEEGK